MEEKPWYLSKTIWASILVVVVSALAIFGRSEEATVVEAEASGIADWIVQMITLVFGAIAFYGRLTAKTKITK